MKHYCDTSFFRRWFSTGAERGKAEQTAAAIIAEAQAISFSSLARLEFIQGLRFDVWLYRSDKSKGMSTAQAEALLNLFLAQAESFRLEQPDYEAVMAQAELLTRRTPERGFRTLDILHVASATVLGASVFHSFDKRENQLAREVGLKTPLVQFSG